MPTRIRSLAIALTLLTLVAAPAFAVDPLPKCQKAKLKAISTGTRGVFTCKGSALRNVLAIDDFSAACVTPVSTRFSGAWNKAIETAAKKAESCFNAPSGETVIQGVDEAAGDAAAEIKGGFAPADDANVDAIKAMNRLMKAAESYLTKTMNIESKDLVKPDAAKRSASRAKELAKFEKAFERETVKLAKKGVTFSGSASSVASIIDAFVLVTANGIRTNIPLPLGKLVDSGVEGVEFLPALDGAGGNFTLRDGYFPITANTMSFWIGNIDLGVGEPQADQDFTVIDLANADDIFDDGATNRARLLQTLDDDGKPKNGIKILACARDASSVNVDFDQSPASFGTDIVVVDQVAASTACTRSGQRILVSAEAAQEHVCRNIVLSANAGKYEGTFTGDDAGTWKTTLTQDGTVKGTGISDDLGNFKVFGKSSCDGAFLAGNASTGASFAGTNRNGVISGFWVNPLYGESGTFYGEKVE